MILFDEPTSALDPSWSARCSTSSATSPQLGTTLIIVTHEVGFAREVADRVVFVDGGRIVEQGPPEQVLVNPQHPRVQDFLAKVLA